MISDFEPKKKLMNEKKGPKSSRTHLLYQSREGYCYSVWDKEIKKYMIKNVDKKKNDTKIKCYLLFPVLFKNQMKFAP